MAWSLLLTLGGLAAIAVAVDQFVIGAARLAGLFGVSPVAIGVIILGFGTSAPELVISGLAAVEGRPDLAVGNIIGSNVANLTLVLGAVALVAAVRASSRIILREAPLAVAAGVLFAVLVQDGLSTTEGIVLLVALLAVLGVVVAGARAGGEEVLAGEVSEFLGADRSFSRGGEVVRTLLGLVVTVAGARVVVHGAVDVAERLGVAEGFIGFSLVAAGTSLPELVTGISAVRRGEHDLLVGNLWGSNVFNALAVGGLAAVVGPARLDDPGLAGAPVVVMLVVSLVAWAGLAHGRRLVRWEGVVLLAGYAVALPLLYR